jgi:hypothetical protein
MSALVEARSLICEVQEIDTAVDLKDDISGIFEDWETEIQEIDTSDDLLGDISGTFEDWVK